MFLTQKAHMIFSVKNTFIMINIHNEKLQVQKNNQITKEKNTVQVTKLTFQLVFLINYNYTKHHLNDKVQVL